MLMSHSQNLTGGLGHEATLMKALTLKSTGISIIDGIMYCFVFVFLFF